MFFFVKFAFFPFLIFFNWNYKSQDALGSILQKKKLNTKCKSLTIIHFFAKVIYGARPLLYGCKYNCYCVLPNPQYEEQLLHWIVANFFFLFLCIYIISRPINQKQTTNFSRARTTHNTNKLPRILSQKSNYKLRTHSVKVIKFCGD